MKSTFSSELIRNIQVRMHHIYQVDAALPEAMKRQLERIAHAERAAQRGGDAGDGKLEPAHGDGQQHS